MARLLAVLLATLSGTLPAGAEVDRDREAHWAGVLADAPDRVELAAGGTPFTALYRPDRSGQPRGALVLLPDIDQHPDWPGVTGPLRRGLPEHGWDTLALQTPVPLPIRPDDQPKAREQFLDTGRKRIDAALRHLEGLGVGNVVLVGHGLGALLAADYLSSAPPGVRGGVLIGIGAPSRELQLDSAALVGAVDRPLLDIYGSRDRPGVIAEAADRASVARRQVAGHRTATYEPPGEDNSALAHPARVLAYRQIVVPGADHRFVGHEQLLLRRIRGWLERHADGRRLTALPIAPVPKPVPVGGPMPALGGKEAPETALEEPAEADDAAAFVDAATAIEPMAADSEGEPNPGLVETTEEEPALAEE